MYQLENVTVRFKDWPCFLQYHNYVDDDSTAIRLLDADDGSPVATATICMSGYNYTPAPDCCFIKDYAENEGMLAMLVEAGIVEETGIELSLGFVNVQEVKILKFPDGFDHDLSED